MNKQEARLKLLRAWHELTANSRSHGASTGNQDTTHFQPTTMRRRNPTRAQLQLSQQELAAYLGVSRSVISMHEQGKRPLPTAALIKLSELEIALGKLTRSKKALPATVAPERAICRQLLQAHLADADWKLQRLQRQLHKMQQANQQVQGRAQMLEVLRVCSGPDCSKGATKWLDLNLKVNELQQAGLQPGNIFMMQHKISMVQLEIAATAKAIGRL